MFKGEIKKMGNLLNKLPEKWSRKIGKTSLKIQEKEPEILFGLGCVAFFGTIFCTWKAAKKSDFILEKHEERLEEIEEAIYISKEENLEDDGELITYTEEEIRRDKMIAYTQTGVDILKLGAPIISLSVLSIFCFHKSNVVLRNRAMAAVSAFNTVSGILELYRKRVREELGDEMDQHFRYGSKYETIEKQTIDEKGKKKTEKEKIELIEKDGFHPSDFCRIFDENNRNWDENPELSRQWLSAQQKILNDILHCRGYLFLNEVYDRLDFKPSQMGCALGWISDDENETYIDFGLYNPENASARRYVNGYDNRVLLDFGTPVVIWDKIEEINKRKEDEEKRLKERFGIK